MPAQVWLRRPPDPPQETTTRHPIALQRPHQRDSTGQRWVVAASSLLASSTAVFPALSRARLWVKATIAASDDKA
jgi:hypothetical protein